MAKRFGALLAAAADKVADGAERLAGALKATHERRRLSRFERQVVKNGGVWFPGDAPGQPRDPRLGTGLGSRWRD